MSLSPAAKKTMIGAAIAMERSEDGGGRAGILEEGAFEIFIPLDAA